MKQRLTHEIREQTEEKSTLTGEHRTEAPLTFDTVEAMIRHDAENTAVPPGMRDRLMQSLSKEDRNANPTPWWKRWMPF